MSPISFDELFCLEALSGATFVARPSSFLFSDFCSSRANLCSSSVHLGYARDLDILLNRLGDRFVAERWPGCPERFHSMVVSVMDKYRPAMRKFYLNKKAQFK
jgi:hypothetical protein